MGNKFKEDKVYKFSVKKYLKDGYTDRKDEDHEPVVTPSNRFSDSGEWGFITLKNGVTSNVHRDWCKVVKEKVFEDGKTYVFSKDKYIKNGGNNYSWTDKCADKIVKPIDSKRGNVENEDSPFSFQIKRDWCKIAKEKSNDN